MLVGSL